MGGWGRVWDLGIQSTLLTALSLGPTPKPSVLDPKTLKP